MKRGASGLSLVVGVDKPAGMSSHDVVNRCRAIFGEKRVGHTGTLDPLASGVLPVCVGPATRLAAFLIEHDKRYTVRIAFGAATSTDDAEGEVLRTGPVPDEVLDPVFAQSFVASLVGKHRQMPPVYSAIKIGGVKACDAARKGRIIDLAPRDIEIYDARLEGVFGLAPNEEPAWDVSFYVSKGTYIRSLARDVGAAVGTPAHVAALRRMRTGKLGIEECVSLSALERLREDAALDPVRLLGFRMAFLNDGQERSCCNGAALACAEVALFERRCSGEAADLCACTAGICESAAAPYDGELVSFIARNKLCGIYEYDGEGNCYRSRCVFQTGVARGGSI